jgi:hypothetical protein
MWPLFPKLKVISALIFLAFPFLHNVKKLLPVLPKITCRWQESVVIGLFPLNIRVSPMIHRSTVVQPMPKCLEICPNDIPSPRMIEVSKRGIDPVAEELGKGV